jgi:hypothetical protein
MKPKKWMGKVILGLMAVAIFVVTGELKGYLEAAIVWSASISLAVLSYTAMYLLVEGEE